MQVQISQNSWLNLADLLEMNGVLFWGPVDLPEIPLSDNDKYVTITQEQSKRVDLLAYDNYGDSELFWVILQANDIDYPAQLFEGMTLRLPDPVTIVNLLKPKT